MTGVVGRYFWQNLLPISIYCNPLSKLVQWCFVHANINQELVFKFIKTSIYHPSNLDIFQRIPSISYYNDPKIRISV